MLKNIAWCVKGFLPVGARRLSRHRGRLSGPHPGRVRGGESILTQVNALVLEMSLNGDSRESTRSRSTR